jgi:hypothetical protein
VNIIESFFHIFLSSFHLFFLIYVCIFCVCKCVILGRMTPTIFFAYKIETNDLNIDLQYMITASKVKQNLVQDIHMHMIVY